MATKSRLLVAWLFGAVVGVLGGYSIGSFTKERRDDPLGARALKMAEDVTDELKIRSIEVGAEVRRAIQPTVSADIDEIHKLNAQDGKKNALVGKNVKVLAPYFRSITGLMVTTKYLMLLLDGSSAQLENRLYIQLGFPDFRILDVGSAS